MENIGPCSHFSFFTVTITLTDAGCECIPDVISSLFEYYAVLKANPPTQELFDEFKTLGHLNFEYSTNTDAATNVEELASSMTMYQPKDYISGIHCLFEYDQKVR